MSTERHIFTCLSRFKQGNFIVSDVHVQAGIHHLIDIVQLMEPALAMTMNV